MVKQNAKESPNARAERMEKEKLVKMKAAKTADEMLDSWGHWLPGGVVSEREKEPWNVYTKKAPELFEHFLHEPSWRLMEKRVLDPKTRELVEIAALAALENMDGVTQHAYGAFLHGATVEEIMEVIWCVIYVNCKNKAAKVGVGLANAIKGVGKW